jgi:endonuclease/exonuclease/phosphatase (EEP) superfamily protein YafD
MNLLIGTVFNAAILGLAAVVIGVLFGKLHPLIDIFSHFLLAAIVGATLFAVAAFFFGRTTQMAILLALGATSLALAWPWLQSPTKAEAAGPRFTVMAFNVYYNNPRLEGVAELVRKTKPDIVVLLEIVPRVRLALDAVADQYPYRVECWREEMCDALVLSRFPLTDNRPSLPAPTFRRPMGAVSVDVQGRTLALFPVHLSLPAPLKRWGLQDGEAKEIARTIASAAGARLIVGDFNASTWGTTMTFLRKELDAAILTGTNGTWPAFLPRAIGIPIDHILASDELALQSRELITVSGSDHRAVLAEIAFKE